MQESAISFARRGYRVDDGKGGDSGEDGVSSVGPSGEVEK